MSTASQFGAEAVLTANAASERARDKIRTRPAVFSAMFSRLVLPVSRILRQIKVQRAHKSLRLCENLSLGEKRFVAVVEVDGERFLLGGSSASVSLLTRLQSSSTFAEALQQSRKEDSAS